MNAWIRELTITLTSSILKNRLEFGTNYHRGEDDLNISVVGTKYMSTLKDACTIRISNLTYKEVVQIIQGQYYQVEIKCGYRSAAVSTIFKGGVLYISNSLGDRKTNTVIILCASYMIAQFGQSRLTLGLNSGINLYSAIRFVCRRAGIPNTNVSTQFKKKFLQDIMNVKDTAAGWIDRLCSNNTSYIANSDPTAEAFFTIYDSNKSNVRVIKLTSDIIDLSGGYPQLTSDGLRLTLMPTFPFMCGDVIEIDNSIIDISVSDQSGVQKNPGYYLDKDGHYTIFQIDFTLTNRGPDFSLNLLCKARSLISNFIGTTETTV